jgi:CheY-like chemotaxis protein
MTRQHGGRDRWRVLLAEDNDDHALLIKMSLERATRLPLELHRARNGLEAIALVQGVMPDLILLDLKMPGRSGHEVLEVVKADDELRRIPIAVLTSSDRDEDVAQSYGLGGNHFITKPENPAELEVKFRTLFSNLDELSSIRRSGGRIEVSAATAFGPGSLEARRILIWGSVLVVVALLVGLAWWTGVL